MQDMLTSLSTYGYLILFFYTLGGGMIAIIAAGVLSYAGKMDITTCIIIAAFSNMLGDTMLFYLGRYSKGEIMPYIRKHRRKLALAHILVKKYGDRIILIKKYIYGLKTLVPIAIGLTGYSFLKFNIINFISSIIWALTLGLLSYYMGDILLSGVEKISHYPWIMPMFLLTLIGGIWLYFQKTTKKTIKNKEQR